MGALSLLIITMYLLIGLIVTNYATQKEKNKKGFLYKFSFVAFMFLWPVLMMIAYISYTDRKKRR